MSGGVMGESLPTPEKDAGIEDLARTLYRSLDWSGCAGSDWDQIAGLHVADRYRAAARVLVSGAKPWRATSLRDTWKPGERVELVSGGYGGAKYVLRPGVVVAIDTEVRRHEFLRVKFDDGEERRINPDVMRHTRVFPSAVTPPEVTT